MSEQAVEFEGIYGGTQQHPATQLRDGTAFPPSYEIRFFIDQATYAHLSALGRAGLLKGMAVIRVELPAADHAAVDGNVE